MNWLEGPWRAPCQLKKTFKVPRWRRGSCFPNKGSLFCPPGKSMIFHIKETEKCWVSGQTCWPPSGWAPPLRPWGTGAGPGGIWEKGPGTPRSQTNAPSATSIRPTWLQTNPNLLTYYDTIPAWIFKGASLIVTHKKEFNKIAQTIRHYFPIQFLLLLQVMCSVLLSVLPIKPIIWDMLIGCWNIQPISRMGMKR